MDIDKLRDLAGKGYRYAREHGYVQEAFQAAVYKAHEMKEDKVISKSIKRVAANTSAKVNEYKKKGKKAVSAVSKKYGSAKAKAAGAVGVVAVSTAAAVSKKAKSARNSHDDGDLYEDADVDYDYDGDEYDELRYETETDTPSDDNHYCFNCGSVLEEQDGFDPDIDCWKCQVCGQLLINPEYDDAFDESSWFCDNCGAYLNEQPGFSEDCGSWTCSRCGYSTLIARNNDLNGDDMPAPMPSIIDGRAEEYSAYPVDHIISRTSQKAEKDQKRQNIIAAIILAVSLLALAAFSIHLYLKDKTRIPFSPSYAKGRDADTVVVKLRNAGFTSVSKVSDNSGWLEENCVISITVAGEKDFKKGKLIDKESKIEVRYSSKGRKYVTDSLEKWEEKSPEEITIILENEGFTNVKLEERNTTSKEDDMRMADISLNGLDFSDESCYLPPDAPIILGYFVYKIRIETGSAEFVGLDYQEVVTALEGKGFSDVQVEEYKQGWARGNSVVSVIIDDKAEYSAEDMFVPDAKVIVKYSSDDRKDVTETVSRWNTVETATAVAMMLEKAGLTNYMARERVGTDLSIADNTLMGLIINNEPYTEGECYIQPKALIEIEYYRAKIVVGDKLGDFMANEKMKYITVVETLKEMGFTDIHLYRNNDLTTGWVDSEGSIASFYVDGELVKQFEEGDSIYRNASIEIVVNTFKKNSCDDITDYKKK